MILETLVTILVGYAFGCIQTAYFLSKLFGNMDIRDHGSGNAGASNITAIMGIKYGIIVGLVDVLKGILAVLIIKGLYPHNPDMALLAGIMVIIGHIFPFHMNFRGGKGVAALVGIMIGLDWKLGVLFALLVIVPALLSDYIVSGSFTTFVALPIITYLSGYPIGYTIIGICLTSLCFYLHRENIRRIINNEELKISSVLRKEKG